jgi:hypothetical protein
MAREWPITVWVWGRFDGAALLRLQKLRLTRPILGNILM